MHQLGYLAPAIAVLGLTASVGLRRKGFSKESLVVQFIGVVYFVLLIVLIMTGSTY